MDIRVTTGHEALTLMGDAAFLADWDRLWRECPWSTGFQSSGFVSAWYTCYMDSFRPVIVTGRAETGRLMGLLPLAISRDSKQLVVAGAHQAEYHCWLAEDNSDSDFPAQAIETAQSLFPGHNVVFRYLPPGVPIAWVTASPRWRCTCLLKTLARPLLRLGAEDAPERSLSKKSNKSKINRMRRLGEVQFRRVVAAEDLEAVFDEIADCYDFRQGALHGVLPFAGDPVKKPFHLAAFRVPGLLHTTVLTVGDRVAAAHLGVCSKDMVHLGIIAHSPFLARHSPGKIHMLMLAQLLVSEGFSTLDLTPGGDAYKEMFSNGHDTVQELTVFAKARHRAIMQIRGIADRSARAALKTAHIQPRTVRSVARRAHPARLAASLGGLLKHVTTRYQNHSAPRTYSLSASAAVPFKSARPLKRDCVSDLLLYVPDRGAVSRKEFLSTSLAKIEEGHHVYTYVWQGRLACCGWVIERQDRLPIPASATIINPAGDKSTVLDLQIYGDGFGEDLYEACICQMMEDARETAGVERIRIALAAGDEAGQRVVEKLGFGREHSSLA